MRGLWRGRRRRTTIFFGQGEQRLPETDCSRSTGTQASDTYVYDPANPVLTTGGPLCCDGAHLAPGPKDQQEVEARSDVLVYTTPPLGQDEEVTGQVTLNLFARSSATDTDFTAKLVDVWPNGFAESNRRHSPRVIGSRGGSHTRSRLGRSTSTRSTCGRPAMSFSRGIASGLR